MSVITDSTTHQEMMQSIDKLEREKKIMREKIGELEGELRNFKKEIKDKNEFIKGLDNRIQILTLEKEHLYKSKDDHDQHNLDMSRLNGISELEA